jgi:hypothetical protein
LVEVDEGVIVRVIKLVRDIWGLREALGEPVEVFEGAADFERVGVAVPVFEGATDLERVGLPVDVLLVVTEPVGVLVVVDDFVTSWELVIVLEGAVDCDRAGLDEEVFEGAIVFVEKGVDIGVSVKYAL